MKAWRGMASDPDADVSLHEFKSGTPRRCPRCSMPARGLDFSHIGGILYSCAFCEHQWAVSLSPEVRLLKAMGEPA